MGLFDGMLGNASKVDPATVQQEFAKILTPGETVQHACQLALHGQRIDRRWGER